ncbi:MAG: type III-A CRISPR-associated RAMP protein Csm3 [Deferribacteraceae bacterium]|jgi:CRISPR-associated protein Csm3|nr:type III-A CRISPR-associated RAMP protein Csm3 [Deferribacteraceae bacterium]
MSLKIAQFDFIIELVSGLHIGGSGAEMRIGGVDNPVIRNPRTDLPIIPGSSLKGKVRSLLEYYYGERDLSVKKLFGYSAADKVEEITRLLFADADIILGENERALFEIKAETAMDRKSGKAKDGSLRFSERVVSGQKFSAHISMKLFEGDDEKEFTDILFKGLKLLTLDALGGSGSRGYGRIKIEFQDSALQKCFDDTVIN